MLHQGEPFSHVYSKLGLSQGLVVLQGVGEGFLTGGRSCADNCSAEPAKPLPGVHAATWATQLACCRGRDAGMHAVTEH